MQRESVGGGGRVENGGAGVGGGGPGSKYLYSPENKARQLIPYRKRCVSNSAVKYCVVLRIVIFSEGDSERVRLLETLKIFGCFTRAMV